MANEPSISIGVNDQNNKEKVDLDIKIPLNKDATLDIDEDNKGDKKVEVTVKI